MATALVDRGKPKGFLRFFLRAPILLYRLRLGFLFGRRFVCIEHVGRKSGLTRWTVVEVVSEDRERGVIYIASGWGEAADWCKNITTTPEIHAIFGVHRRAYRAERLSAEQARARLEDYGAHHPAALRQLAKLMLGERHATIDEICQAMAPVIPMFSLVPRD